MAILEAMKTDKIKKNGVQGMDDKFKALQNYGQNTLVNLSANEPQKVFDADAYMEKLIAQEEAFLNPEKYGIDLRPIVEKYYPLSDDVDKLHDVEVEKRLVTIVSLLCNYHLCLKYTNHLTDRELLKCIVEKVLPLPLGLGPDPKGTLVYHECLPCDTDEYLMYYEDEDTRLSHAEYFDEPVLESRPLVADRDKWLDAFAESFRHEPFPDDLK